MERGGFDGRVEDARRERLDDGEEDFQKFREQVTDPRSCPQRLASEIRENGGRVVSGRRTEVSADTDGLGEDATALVPCDARTMALELPGNSGPVKFGLIALPAT